MHQELSPRQTEILEMAAEGQMGKQIALTLGISPVRPRSRNAFRLACATVAASALGLALSIVVSPPWQATPASTASTSSLVSLPQENGPAKFSADFEGFRVDYQRAVPANPEDLVVYYKVAVANPHGFGDMLGIPRIINPDGQIILPREYGGVGAVEGYQGGIRGLPAGSLGAIFERAKVLPGAAIRFGPFFRSSDGGFGVTANGAELAAGLQLNIEGEPFTISSIENKDGSTTVEFVNTAAKASVVASHPGSRVSVTVDGKEAETVRGSTNFAKTVGYDVNANRSAVTIPGRLSPTSVVTITNDSSGRVYRGQWDFPLE